MASVEAQAAPGAGAGSEGTAAPRPPSGPLKIPLTFERWFWSADYRKGVTVLFSKLQAGLRESEELLTFVNARLAHERGYANELGSGLAPLDSQGFGLDDGASLLAAFRQLRTSQSELAEAHARVARHLERNVANPFETWSIGHEERVRASIGQVEAILGRWEGQSREVAKLKERYERKGREADDADDEAKFAPTAVSPPTTGKKASFLPTTMRRSDSTPPDEEASLAKQVEDDTLVGPGGTKTGEGVVAIGKMVGEQAVGLGRALTQRVRTGGGRVGLRATSIDVPRSDSADAAPKDPAPVLSPVDTSLKAAEAGDDVASSPSELTPTSHTAEEKGKLKQVDEQATGGDPIKRPAPETKESLFVGGDDASGPLAGVANPGGVKLLEIAGIVRAPFEWSRLFAKARDTVYKQSVKVPFFGTYEGAQDGESLVIFFKRNVAELEGDDEWAIRFCKELSEDLAILRLIGEIGNKFMATPDAFYLWKPEAFQLHQVSSTAEPQDFTGTYTALPDKLSHSPRPGSPTKGLRPASPTKRSPVADGPARAPLASYFRTAMNSTAFQTALNQARQGITDLSTQVSSAAAGVGGERPGETRHERLRREALTAETAYASAVRSLDRSRLHLEETISEHLQFLQRCELDRLRAAKVVIAGYNAALALLGPAVKQADDAAAVAHESLSPEADVAALVERHRTGPFRPAAQVFQCHWGELVNVTFGIDLRRWYDGQEVAAAQGKEVYQVPPVLSALLKHLEERYSTEPSQTERRKWWIYEVPLRATHALREALIDPDRRVKSDMLARVDGPVIASTVKLWLLELEPPPIPTQRYDEVRVVFADATMGDSERAGALKSILAKLPKVHLLVLDVVISHLRSLIAGTQTDEDDDVFLTKLGLSLARSLLRPQAETPVSLSDRFQPLFLADLIKRYDDIIPPAIEHQKQTEAERLRPTRQRTRPVDLRVRRSALGGAAAAPTDAHQLLEKQRRRASGEQLPPSEAAKSPTASPIPEETPVPPPVSESTRPRPTGPGQPEDLPFVPPTEQGLLAPEAPSSPSTQPATPGSDSFQDALEPSPAQVEAALELASPAREEPRPVEASEDVPLAKSAGLQRPQPGGNLGSGSSLSRSAGIRGPRGPRASGEGPGHRKAGPSIDALRSQFEPGASKPDKSRWGPR